MLSNMIETLTTLTIITGSEAILIFLLLITLVSMYKFYFQYYPRFSMKVQNKSEKVELSHEQFEDMITMTLDKDDFINSCEVISRWYEARDNKNFSLPLSDVEYTLTRIPKNRKKSTPKIYNMIIHKINTVLYEV